MPVRRQFEEQLLLVIHATHFETMLHRLRAVGTA